MPSTEYSIETERLTRRFGTYTAVDGLTLRVPRGEIFGFLGPNGAGKSTTIRMLSGLLDPSAGKAMVVGYDVHRSPEAVKQRIGYMSQRFSLYADLTCWENLEFFASIYGLRGRARTERLHEVLEMVGLAGRERSLAGTLSGGNKQRLALGAAIAHRPALLFLDEPTAGVDPMSRRRFWRIIHDLAQTGLTVFATTHYLDEGEFCHRLGFFFRGRVLAMGTPQEIKDSQIAGQVVELSCAPEDVALERLAAMPGVKSATPLGSTLRLLLSEAGVIETIREPLERAGVTVKSLTATPPTIEDVYIALIGDLDANVVYGA